MVEKTITTDAAKQVEPAVRVRGAAADTIFSWSAEMIGSHGPTIPFIYRNAGGALRAACPRICASCTGYNLQQTRSGKTVSPHSKAGSWKPKAPRRNQ